MMRESETAASFWAHIAWNETEKMEQGTVNVEHGREGAGFQMVRSSRVTS